MNIRFTFCITLLGLLLVAPVLAATTQVNVVKYANDNTTILAEETVNYSWMAANLPVLGDGTTHYYHQGPVFVDNTNETLEQELRWNPAEDTNVQEKDMGAVKGTNLKDICDLVGGMSPGEKVKIQSSDGWSKWLAYKNVYEYSSREGPIGICWYKDGQYPDTGYSEGMRMVWFADTSVNTWGIHAFGNYDWHEAADAEYWYYYQSGGENYPTTIGLSGQYVNRIFIYSNEAAPTSPVAAFSGTPTSGTAPLTVAFTDASTGTPTSWAWDFNNDGDVDSTQQNPQFIYTSAGTYSVNLTVTNTAGSDSLVKSRYISVTSTNTTVFFNPPSSVVANGETASMTIYANIFPAGLAGFNISVSLANPQTGEITGVTFPSWASLHSNSSEMPADSIWFSGVDLNRLIEPGATNVTLGTIQLRGDNPGTTDLMVEVIQMDADGGAIITPAVVNGNLAVEGTLTANFSADKTSGQAPLLVHFTDASTGAPTNWAWDFNNDSTVDSTAQNPQHTYSSAGSYSVKLTVTNSAGSDSETKTNYITVTTAPVVPVAAFSGTPTSGTAPLTVQFIDASTGAPTNWAWDFNNDSTVDNTLQSPSHTYGTAGTYSVKLTVTNSAGSDSETKTNYITVTAAPVAPIAAFSGTPTSGTAPLTVQFTNASIGAPTSWAWDFNNDGTVDSTAQNPQHTYSSAGTYSVKLIVTNSAGNDSETKTNYITVTAAPVAPIAAFSGTPTSGTAPLTVRFTDASTGAPTSWAWDFNNDGTVDSIAQNPQHTYDNPGTYSVGLTVTNNAGSDTELKISYITVTGVIPPITGVPVADFIAKPASGTAPLTVQFTDLSTGNPDQWNWDFNNDGFIDATSRNPIATFRDPGDYTVRLWVYNSFGGDAEVKSMYIHVTGATPAFPADLDFLGMAKFVRQFIPI